MTAIVLTAPAKLTVSLRVTGVRADGYHLIDAEMVTLAVHDLLTVDPDGSGLTASGPFSEGMPVDDSNLVAKALHLCGRRAAVHIDKQIPHGGGLGGGSSDAAAVLRWAGYTDVRGAARLGADVSFCLVGGRARVTGIGDEVEPLPVEPRTFTLVIPPLNCPTPAVYRAWDAMGGPVGDHGNDLEPAALRVVPEMADWRDRITNLAGERPRLAGSGATWFLDGSRPELAEKMPNSTVVVTHTVD
jgi:4-diphosphocytidyl-2-C-methyl-D-erythritol kinase